jgi:hypothetical protein
LKLRLGILAPGEFNVVAVLVYTQGVKSQAACCRNSKPGIAGRIDKAFALAQRFSSPDAFCGAKLFGFKFASV